MPNTTTIAVASFMCDIGVKSFMEDSGYTLHQILSDDMVERGYIVPFEFWALSVRSVDAAELRLVIDIFMDTVFEHPENACLIISCDDNEDMEGCYPRVEKVNEGEGNG